MQRGGLQPIPTRVKILRGNPGNRALNKSEPQPKKSKSLRAPSYLCKEAQAEYRRIGKMLKSIGVLTEADLTALKLYAETYAVWLEATQKVHVEGLCVRAPNGYQTQNPNLAISQNASKRLQSLLCEFGMTPSSRTRVTVAKKEKNEFDDV